MSLIKVLHLAVDMDNLFVCFFVHVYAFWPLFFGLFLDHKETYGDWYQPSLLERTSARKHTLVFSAYRSLPLKTEKLLLMTVGKTAYTARAMLIVGLRKENNFLAIKAGKGCSSSIPSRQNLSREKVAFISLLCFSSPVSQQDQNLEALLQDWFSSD